MLFGYARKLEVQSAALAGIVAAILFVGCGSSSTAVAGILQPNSIGRAVTPYQANALRYTITDLGTLGGTFSEAVGVNNLGNVSGYSTLPGDSVIHAFYWHDTTMTDLGTLGGPNSFAPESGPPNERGEVAGMSDTSASNPDPNDGFCGIFDFLSTSPNICLPFVWQHGSMTALPTLGGSNGAAFAINNQGESVGTAETAIKDPTCSPPLVFDFQGVIWGPRRDEIRKLRPLRGDNLSNGMAINDRGEAVGTSGTCVNGPIEAVLWWHGTPINLGTLGGAVLNIAFGVNNRSEVVGQSDLKGDTTHHAFLWRNGKMLDLGSIHGLPVSLAAGINNKTQVVGFSQDQNNNNTVAWLWQDGTMTDLNTLIPARSHWFFIEALGINDRGQIVGYAYNSVIGQVHSVLATPCDERNADRRECDTARSSLRPTVNVPWDVSRLLRQRQYFGRFGGWLSPSR